MTFRVANIFLAPLFLSCRQNAERSAIKTATVKHESFILKMLKKNAVKTTNVFPTYTH